MVRDTVASLSAGSTSSVMHYYELELIWSLPMDKDSSREVYALHHVIMVVRSNGSSPCAVKTSSLLKSVASVLT